MQMTNCQVSTKAKRKYVKNEYKPLCEWEVTHILADGTTRKSMKGYEVPYNENTSLAYYMLANCK